MPKDLLLFPFGGTAREALLTIMSSSELKKQWNILGFVDDNLDLKGRNCCGVQVIGSNDVFERYPKAMVLAVPAHPKYHLDRKSIIENLSIDPSRFATIIHPSCILSPDANVGYNTFISPNCVVSVNACVGNHCVLLSHSTVSHDSRIGDFCCLGSGVIVSGGVSVGNLSYIGPGTSIRENISIGAESFIGMGSNVVSDVLPQMLVFGNPAKVARQII